MTWTRTILLMLAALAVTLLFTCRMARGQVLVTETEQVPPTSRWLYTIAVTNPSAMDAIWAVDFGFGPDAAVHSYPPNWPYTQLDLETTAFFSASPGVPPAGTDLAPGASLVFAILSNERLGEIPYILQLEDGAGNDSEISGVAVVPEASTLAVLGLGAAGLLLRRKAVR